MREGLRPDHHLGRSHRPVPPATGTSERRDGRDWVVYARRLTSSAEVVWRALTAPEELAGWIGTWRRREDAENHQFYFTHDGDDVLPLSYRLRRLEQGRSIALSMFDPGAVDAWQLEVEVRAEGQGTVLTVGQAIANPAFAPSVAAGCEFYLDRLVTYLAGGDVGALDYDEYFIAQADHYRRLFPVQRRRVSI